MIFFVLIIYGTKPSGSYREHPQAKTQIDIYEKLLEGCPEVSARYVIDSARRINGLASLPKLNNALTSLSNMDGFKIRFLDLSRLFSYTDLNKREAFLQELNEYAAHIFSVRHKKALSDFSADEIYDLILHPEKSKLPSKQGQPRDTKKARSSSMISRTGRAISTARKFYSMKEELVSSEGRATLQMVADQANVRGMRTSRGKKWTAPNVGRMLDLLERAEQEN